MIPAGSQLHEETVNESPYVYIIAKLVNGLAMALTLIPDNVPGHGHGHSHGHYPALDFVIAF